MTKDEIDKIEAHAKMAGNLLHNADLAEEAKKALDSFTELSWQHRRDVMANVSALVQTYPTLQAGLSRELSTLVSWLRSTVDNLPSVPDFNAPVSNERGLKLLEEEEGE